MLLYRSHKLNVIIVISVYKTMAYIIQYIFISD